MNLNYFLINKKLLQLINWTINFDKEVKKMLR